MLKASTLTYYDFNDIEKFICKELEIEQKFFRDYHEIIGGSYKDFWHVWLDLNYDTIHNGGYIDLWFDMVHDRLKDLVNQYGDWILVLEPILEKLENEVDSEYICINYSW